jgi:hypothetical protein
MNKININYGVKAKNKNKNALFVHSWLTKNKVENKPLEERMQIRNCLTKP